MKLKNYDKLSLIAEGFANLYEDGISISKSIELLENLPLNKRYKETFKVIRENVESGNSLSSGFEQFPKLYPSLFTGLLKIGENSGEMNKVLNSISDYYSKCSELKKEIIQQSIYPVFLLFVLILVSNLAFFVVVPVLGESYKNFGIPMPEDVKNLYSLSSFVKSNAAAAIFILISAIALIVFIFKMISKLIRGILLKFKIVKQYFEYIFVLLLSVVIKSGIPLGQGIELCKKNCGIVILQDEFQNIQDNIMKGETLSKSFSRNNFFSGYFLAMIVLAEESGSLDKTIANMERRLKKDSEDKMKKIMKIISPVLLIIMAGIVVTFIYFFVIPMMNGIYMEV